MRQKRVKDWVFAQLLFRSQWHDVELAEEIEE